VQQCYLPHIIPRAMLKRAM